MGPFSGNAETTAKAEIGLDGTYKWVNDQGGVNGRKFETVLEDYALTARSITRDKNSSNSTTKYLLLHGNSCSAVAMAIKPVVLEAGIPAGRRACRQWRDLSARDERTSSTACSRQDHGCGDGEFIMTNRVSMIAVINIRMTGRRAIAVGHGVSRDNPQNIGPSWRSPSNAARPTPPLTIRIETRRIQFRHRVSLRRKRRSSNAGMPRSSGLNARR